LGGPDKHEKHDLGAKLFGLVLQKLGVADILNEEDQETLMYNLMLSAAVIGILGTLLCIFLALYRMVKGLSLCCVPRAVTHPVDAATAILRRFFQGERNGDYWFDVDQVGFYSSDSSSYTNIRSILNIHFVSNKLIIS